MLIKKILLSCCVLITLLSACKKDSAPETINIVQPPTIIIPPKTFPEKFEYGTKADYTAGDVTLATGLWNMDDALLGSTTSDRKKGTVSMRMQNTGTATMKFDATGGASVVTLYCGSYGAEAPSTFELWVSVNGGLNWIQAGSAVTVSSTSLTQVYFGMNYYNTVRVQIRKTGGGQLNIDDINILPNDGTPSQDDNMGMGNPDNSVSDAGFPLNFLLERQQYAYSYNNTRGTANWVSWHLSTAWKGPAPRCDCFTPDDALPSAFFHATSLNYTATGFDRGHLCPSDDRDLNSTDNSTTFLMGNIMPQAPNLNQVVWGTLEDYCRTLINSGNELYIMAGGYGMGGTGSLGGVTNTIASGQITVPSRYWKVIVVLPVGSNDAMRVLNGTRVIAVDMPNVQTVSSQTWGNYRVSVDALEATLGYDFLSNVSPEIQQVIEANVDNGPTH